MQRERYNRFVTFLAICNMSSDFVVCSCINLKESNKYGKFSCMLKFLFSNMKVFIRKYNSK